MQHKYRIYDKLLKQYITDTMQRLHTIAMDGSLCVYDEKSRIHYRLDTTRYTIEWWTGLVDCKGVDIYMGDIMCLTNDGKPTAEIVFETFGGFSFKWVNETFRLVRNKNTEPLFRNISLFEVIGNIHAQTTPPCTP